MTYMNRHGKAYVIKHSVERGTGLDLWTVEQRVAPNAWAEVYWGEDYADCVSWVESR